MASGSLSGQKVLVMGTMAAKRQLESAGATALVYTGPHGQKTVTFLTATIVLVRRPSTPAPAWRSGTEVGAESAG